jgi:hypothetical protein
MARAVIVSWAILALAGGCSDAPGSGTTDEPFDPAALTDLARIAELRPPGLSVAQVSSYDRTGGNADLGIGPDTAELLALLGVPPTELDNSYLYRDGERYVVFDEVGPGLVARIWMTGLDSLFRGALGGDVAFDFDDEPVPRLVLTREELFSGARAPFLAPLAGDAAASSGGYYSVLPMPFAHRLRISTSVVPNWLQITWTRLPRDAAVASFDPAAEPGALAAALRAAGTDPKGIAAEIEDEREPILSPGESTTVWEHDGPGTVLSLEVLAAGDLDLPTGLVLEARWDDAASPQVAAPLDDLFGASLGPGARSLAFGRDGGRYYLYFPMPFQRSARITLRNDGGETFAGWRTRIRAVPRLVGREPAPFHAAARSARLEPDGRDYVLLERGGTGHVVGVVVTAGCGEAGRCQLPQIANLDGAHLEGDERVQVDGSRWPQVHGTGLEDFFGGGFYFARGAFTLPTHGNPAQAPTTSPRRPGINLRSAYRLLLADAIPFRDGIRLAVEHGGGNDVPAEMSSVVFHYAVPEGTLERSDDVVLGDAASEAAHALEAEGRVDRTLTSALRGDESDAPFTLRGFDALRTRFRVAVRPDADGVRLRRVADIGGGTQRAMVRIDGRDAGIWQTSEVNPVLRWAVLDLDLPASLTRGRDSIAVEIDATASPSPWTAYGYEAWSFVGPGER